MSGNDCDEGEEGPESLIRVRGQAGPQFLSAKYWTAESEAAFLDHLAASANVTRAAARAGFSKVTVYNKRRSDPGFATRWQAALEQGYARLEMMLVRSATNAMSLEPPDPEAPFAEMTVAEAMNLLRLHHAAAKGQGPRAPGGRWRPRPLDELRDSILLKLEAIEAARQAGELPEVEIRQIEAPGRADGAD